jgi:hypothetical protein
MTYDQSRSPRLGQRTTVDTPSVQLALAAEEPEAPYKGQLIYLTDTQVLQLYDGENWITLVDNSV